MGYRFNPPPGWPPPPEGFVPASGWQPDASWPPLPPGWPLWIYDRSAPGSLAAAPSAVPSYRAGGDAGYLEPRAGTNGFAIASLILGILSVALLGVIFGLIALAKIRARPQAGKGLAIAGIALSCAWVAGAVAVVAIHAAGAAHRSAITGQITGNGSVGVFSLRVGDCFQNPSGSQAAVAGVTEVPAVPCTIPHNAQVFAQLQATGTSYPGHDSLLGQASRGCRAQIAASLDKSKITSTMRLRFLFPLSQSWADGRRTITCLVVDPTPDLTSSLLK